MKRWIGLGLMLTLIICNCMVVMAGSKTYDGTNSVNENTTLDVTGSITGSMEIVYKVDVTWDAMTFTYTKGEETWDATNHEYVVKDGNSPGTWSKTNNKITITNYSNAGINVGLTFDQANVRGAFNTNAAGSGTVISNIAINEAFKGIAQTGIGYLVLSGAPSTTWLNNPSLALGTITVSIKE